MKAILYCRKSTDSEDKQVMSLDAQEYELRALAEKEGIEIVKVYRESMSAKAPGRPHFAEMLKLITAGKADSILCWKIDRLARNPVDGGSISWLLQSSTIKTIRTHERTYLPSDNVLLLYVELGMSNQYVRDLSENVKRGNREKLRRGEWINRAPYGYKNDKNTKTLVVIASQAKIVRQAFSLYATGNYSFTQLAKELGIQKSQLERILSRKFYYGVMEAVGGEYPGIHKPIITKQLFDQVQAIKTGVTVTKSRPQKLEFPYRGFMYCAECGCMLTATVKKGKYDYYYCTNGKGICTQHKEYLNDKAVTTLLATEIQKLHFDEEIIEIMYKADRERLENGSYNVQGTVDGLNLQLHKIKQQERKLLHSFTTGLIEEDLYTEEAHKLGKEKQEVKSKLRHYSQNAHTGLATLELTKEVFMTSNKAVLEFETAEPERKREIVNSLLWNCIIKDKKVLETKYKRPFSVLAHAPKNGSISELLAVWDSNFIG
ncbi:MAG: recombinase family protein [Candidatus Pacebacteria bacterium]|nr:recombinase family protein [Candidatus Paceibacterota bacterium]